MLGAVSVAAVSIPQGNREEESTNTAEQTEEETRKLRPKVSRVWEHFTENKPVKHVKCNLCEAQLSFHGSTTVTHEHLKRRQKKKNANNQF